MKKLLQKQSNRRRSLKKNEDIQGKVQESSNVESQQNERLQNGLMEASSMDIPREYSIEISLEGQHFFPSDCIFRFELALIFVFCHSLRLLPHFLPFFF